MKKYILLFSALLFVFLVNPVSAASLSQRLSGKIILQVESHGEAWYVNPTNAERYYLGRPADAFEIMKKLGIGISDQNLKKIPIETNLSQDIDSDGDGLPDEIEKSIGTNINLSDSDSDGYSDFDEIKNGFNPTGEGKIYLDITFSQKQGGKILLQVESHGEAWYVNPKNNKRYFLGRPTDAFEIMKKLGLGISNKELNQIKISSASISLISGNIDISQSPKQIAITDSSPVVTQSGSSTTTLTPLYNYKIAGKVEDIVEVKDEAYDIMPVDVVLTWGILATYNDVVTSYHTGRIANNQFHYYEGQKLCDTGDAGECISNNHLIPANDNINQAILTKIKKGDFVEMEGYLVNGEKVTKTGNQIQVVKFTTSTVRSDEGINSCEIIYLTSIKINQEIYQ